MRPTSTLWLALGVLLSSSTAVASTLTQLYQNRLLFDDDGKPQVSVRLMERQSRVRLFAEEQLTCRFEDDTVWQVPVGSEVVVDVVKAGPAQIQSHTILQTLEADERTHVRERLQALRKLATPLKLGRISVVQVGGVYGVKGTVVDNRASLLVSEHMPKASLAEKHGLRPVEGGRLLGLPASTLRVSHPALGSKTIAAADAVLRCAATQVGGAVLVKDVEHDVGFRSHGKDDRAYRKEVVVLPDRDGTLAVVNLVDETTLVAGVLPSEMFASAPMEALKAQAVTARGELYSKIGRRFLADPYLTCSSQMCQVYRGVRAETAATNEAATSTVGELAFNGERLIESVYSACAGGHTAAAHIVWPHTPKAPLRGLPDTPLADPAHRPWAHTSSVAAGLGGHRAGAFLAVMSPIPLDLRDERAVRRFLDVGRPETFSGRSTFNQKYDHYRWERTFTQADLQAMFAADKLGPIRSLQVTGRGPGGRLKALKVVGDQGQLVLQRELPVRRKLKGLRSGLFVVDEQRDAQGQLQQVTLRGAGFGHGAGMSQQGAIGMAESGFSYQAILHHYYGGATVRRVF